MNLHIKLICGTLFTLLFLSACGSSNTKSTKRSDTNNTTNQELNATPYSYEQDIYPILTLKCLRCHGKNGNFRINSKNETYQLLLHTAPRASTGYTHFIEKGSLAKSLIYQKALNIELHGGGEILHYDSPQAKILKSWILQGAQRDNNKTRHYTLLAWNDLGMHCMDGKDFSVFSILPPYNNLQAQLINNDLSQYKLINSNITINYTAAKSLDEKYNTTSLLDTNATLKTNFWNYVQKLFLSSPAQNRGLSGNAVPSLQPQALEYNATRNWWEATALPITPYNDDGTKNYYPMVTVSAKDSNGTLLARTTVVLPVSDEMNCKVCHSSNDNYTATKPSAGWEYDPDIEKDYKYNILKLHDDRFPNAVSDNQTTLKTAGYNNYDNAGLYSSVKNGNPILCATCHASNALPGTGIVGIKPLTEAIHFLHANATDPTNGKILASLTNRSACYRCHPGATTQCLRGAMGSKSIIQCQSCHGDMNAVGKHGRVGWLDEPNCQACHQDGQRYTTAVTNTTTGILRTAIDTRFATTPNTPQNDMSIYKFSTGHGNMQCSACHGSTHAIYPSSHTEDNLQSIAAQGHNGTVAECNSCHSQTPRTIAGGPHGMHTVGASWITDHQDAAKNDKTECKACHGDDYKGTFLSKTSMPRDLVRHYSAKELVSCYDCHNGPNGH